MTKQNLDVLRLTCRFDADTADYVRGLADVMELPKAEVVRLALDYVGDRVPPSLFEELGELPPETRRELARLTREVNSIGVNINQLVRAVNTLAVGGALEGRVLHATEVNHLMCDVREQLEFLHLRIYESCQ